MIDDQHIMNPNTRFKALTIGLHKHGLIYKLMIMINN